MNKAISVDNLGPIEHFEFSGSKPGITVFSGPNGIGKSIFQKAIEAAAAGPGNKVPLRDNTRSGRCDIFGVTITIGANCRHTGAFEVLTLSGRINLADLVDPRKESPTVCDNKRIKALVTMTGVKADVNRFRGHEAFAATFDAVVSQESTESDDLVEMARLIQKNYYDAALTQERRAERETAMASALVPPADLDLTDESDAEVLQASYNEARDEVTKLAEQKKQAKASHEKIRLAKESMQALGDDELEKERANIVQSIKESDEAVARHNKDIAELEDKIAKLKSAKHDRVQMTTRDEEQLKKIDKQLLLVADAKKVLSESVTDFPDEDDIADCNEALELAAKAIETGTLIRSAKADAKKAQEHRAAAKLASETALKYRDAGKATDTILSDAINCKYLRVESDGKAARLYADTPERGKTLYHDLSDGQKYKIAIDIGADQVGEDGLLTVDQIGWEGIDADNRVAIDAHAKERGVHIWVLEASREVGAPREIVAKQFDPASLPHAPERVVEQKAPMPSIDAIAQAALLVEGVTGIREAKPVAVPKQVAEVLANAAAKEKAKEKSMAKAKAPAKPPAPVVPDDEDEDVPF